MTIIYKSYTQKIQSTISILIIRKGIYVLYISLHIDAYYIYMKKRTMHELLKNVDLPSDVFNFLIIDFRPIVTVL